MAMAPEEVRNLKLAVMAEVDGLAPRLRALSAQIHAVPELGYQEFRAAGWLSNFLAEAGFHVERGVAGMATAFRATFRQGTGRPCVAFLAEYDALPEIGHGCGHNIIGTASAGAAVALRKAITRLARSLPCTVMVLGSPAEEGAVDMAGGKVVLVRHGMFRDVDAAMMVHPATRTVTETTSTAREAIEISFRGRPAHAAGCPTEGINALDGVIQTFNGFNALRQHLRDDVRIHGIITRGGVAPNIVPDYAEARIYVRAFDLTYLKEVVEKVKNCARGAALATGAEVSFRPFAYLYERMVTNRTLAAAFTANLEELRVTVEEPERQGYGSTDMGNVSQVVPSIHPYIAISRSRVSGHSRDFAQLAASPDAHRALLTAARALAMTAVDVYTQQGMVDRAWQEFEEKRAMGVVKAAGGGH